MTTPDRPRSPARRVRVAALLVALGLPAAVLAAGGFERRTAPTLAVAAGTELDAGNLVFRLDSATVQYRSQSAATPWLVVVSGSVRNPNDTSLAPLSGDWGNLAGIDRPSDQIVVQPRYRLGTTDPENPWANRRQVVPPVDRWIDLEASFEFAAGYRPGDSVDVGVVPMEFTANSVLGLNEDPTWNPDSYARPWVVTVPLTRLPDTDY